MTTPCSVPTKYFDGPASELYSNEDPPSTCPLFLLSVDINNESVGSLSFLVSHQSICPSVETDTHWLPVLELIQKTSYTEGRRQKYTV